MVALGIFDGHGVAPPHGQCSSDRLWISHGPNKDKADTEKNE